MWSMMSKTPSWCGMIAISEKKKNLQRNKKIKLRNWHKSKYFNNWRSLQELYSAVNGIIYWIFQKSILVAHKNLSKNSAGREAKTSEILQFGLHHIVVWT